MQEGYIKRVDDQIDWMDKKAAMNKNWHTWFSMISIALGASIPIMIWNLNDFPNLKSSLFYVSMVSAATNAIAAHFRWHDEWMRYRRTVEQLKSEKAQFEAETGKYSDAERFHIYVATCEQILFLERVAWLDEISRPSQSSSTLS